MKMDTEKQLKKASYQTAAICWALIASGIEGKAVAARLVCVLIIFAMLWVAERQ